MRRITVRLPLVLVLGLLGGLGGPGIGVAQTTDAPAQLPAQLRGVSVERSDDGITVRVRTSGRVKYEASLIDTPTRLVVDLSGTIYAWSKTRMATDLAPIREIRGSQFKPGVARVVVEMTRKAGYRIDQGPDGLVVVIEPSATAKSEAKEGEAAPAVTAKSEARPATAAPAPSAKKAEDTQRIAKPVAPPAPESKKQEAFIETAKSRAGSPKPAEATAEAAKPARKTDPPVVAQAGAPVVAPVPAPMPAAKAAVPLPMPVVVGQAQTSPAPGAQTPVANGGKPISLDFKDADVVNLLRILAAESGRNIVAGEDVKGKASVSLRNVTWEQALDTILEVRGLAKVERAGVIRIISLDQLTKEREALARVEEAKRRAEIETRTKLAEAQLKEADLAAKRAAAEAAAEELRARGPVREETIRLSYADAEEVARTLQGILGLPPEGVIPAPQPQLYAPPPPVNIPSGPPPPPPTIPVPAASPPSDALGKGLTVKAHKPTNSVFIRYYEKDLERIKKLVKEQLDIAVPQVQIAAQMVIMTHNALENIGIQWGGAAIGQPTQGRGPTLVGSGFATGQAPAGGTGVVGIVPANPNFTGSGLLPISPTTGFPAGGNLVNLPVSFLATGANPALGALFGIISRDFNLNLAIQALEIQGKARTLAEPKIVTVENSKAEITRGREVPFVSASAQGTQVQFKEALLKLTVVPNVIREADTTKIRMKVSIANDEPDFSAQVAGNPSLFKRSAVTEVVVREGERLVIGGVLLETSNTNLRQVPLLGRIPVLGWLFKSREFSSTAEELVVIITPSVLKADGARSAQATPGR